MSARLANRQPFGAGGNKRPKCAARCGDGAFQVAACDAMEDVAITFMDRDIVQVKWRESPAVIRERLHIPGVAKTTTGEKGALITGF